MNRRYIDFVPKKEASNVTTAPVVVMPPEASVSLKPRQMTDIQRVRNVRATEEAEEVVVTPPEKEIPEITTVKAEKIPRIPLFRRPVEKSVDKVVEKPVEKSEDFADLTGKKEARKPERKSEARPDEKTLAQATKTAGDLDRKLKIPKVAFVNTEKIVKRPLSKNVYQKKIVTPEEKPQGPVTIIAKPEKDSRVSLVVTIIITIILGAAAGTVAFLLLPK